VVESVGVRQDFRIGLEASVGPSICRRVSQRLNDIHELLYSGAFVALCVFSAL
jgi:hypothetical protein